MSGAEPSRDGRREILRQASVALGGRPVTLWAVSGRAELDPQLSSDPNPTHHDTHLDIESTLARWNIPIVQGSRWVGVRAEPEGAWIIAPLRTRPPAPPRGRERRGRERLTLELAGLCLGLMDRAEQAQAPITDAQPARDIGLLPGVIAHELANRLTSARAATQLAIESVGRWSEVDAARRLELIDELGHVLDDLDRGTQFLRAVKDRARGALAHWERFDAARVVQSCCTLEARVMKERLPVTFEGSVEPVYLLGDPNALYDTLVNLIRNAADAMAGRTGAVRVALERAGASLRLSIEDNGVGIPEHLIERIFEPGFTTKDFGQGTGMGLPLVQEVVRTMFGGSVAVESQVGAGTTVRITLPIPPQRSAAPSPSAPPT